jgi:hypothetical protein
MQPKVPDALKRQALKKLFTQPQFNVMDGLDVYVDDYSVSVPIPDDWYKDISSWQAMLNPKPPMVVTDGGYAVEADSEEGVATLARRAQLAGAPADEAAELATVPHVEHVSRDGAVSPTPSPLAPLPQGEGDLAMNFPPPGGEGAQRAGEGGGVAPKVCSTPTHDALDPTITALSPVPTTTKKETQ